MNFNKLFFTEQCGRNYQEDYAYPKLQDADKQQLFIICDGMGGHAAGDIASRLVAESIANQQPQPDDLTEDWLQNAVDNSADTLFQYAHQHLFGASMGTTLAMLHKGKNTVTAAHCGDSRIYHWRNGSILWRSQDHSYVNQLVAEGLITAQEALNHPRRHVLARAISSSFKTSHKADLHCFSDVQAGDIFLICSDGVYHQLSDADMEAIWAKNGSAAAFLEHLRQLCFANKGDNSTAWLLEVVQ